MKNKLKTILDLLMVSIPFIDFAYYTNMPNMPDIRLTYLFYLIYFVVYIKNFFDKNIILPIIKDFKNILIILITIILISVYNILIDNNTAFLFLKQITITLFIAFTTFMFFYNHKDNIKYIIDLYLKFSFFVACFGIFQEFSYLAGFTIGYDQSFLKIHHQISKSGLMLRVTSITGEPPYLAFALIPAFYITLHSFLTDTKYFLNKYQSLAVIICLFLTYSTIGYIAILLSFVSILFWDFKKIILRKLFIFIIISFTLFALGSNGITMRISHTYKEIDRIIFKSLSENNSEKEAVSTRFVNETTYYMVLHAQRAFEDLKTNPLFGTGMGSYTYPKNAIKNYEKFHYNSFFKVSTDDVFNTLFRITSEFGLFGIIILFAFIFYNYIFNFRFRNRTNYFIIINNAFLIYLLLRLVKNNGYYSDGLWIFIFMYYYSKQLFLEQNKNENA
jgi:hypothetical protein